MINVLEKWYWYSQNLRDFGYGDNDSIKDVTAAILTLAETLVAIEQHREEEVNSKMEQIKSVVEKYKEN